MIFCTAGSGGALWVQRLVQKDSSDFRAHTHLWAGTNLSLSRSQVCFLRWGWVFSRRTRILRGIQCTTHLIDFFVVETKQFIGSSGKWSWRCKPAASARAGLAESLSKRRALENYFSERICYMFRMSKCRGDWDLGYYMFGVQKKTAAHWRLPKKNVFRPQEKLIFCVMWNATKFSRTSLNCGNALGFERWSGGHCQQPKTRRMEALLLIFLNRTLGSTK